MKQHLAVVSGGAEPVPGARLLYLDCPSLRAGARPGQFILIRQGASYDPYLRFALPLHRLTEQGAALYFRPASPALAWLAAQPIGEALDVLGPCGRGFDLPAQVQEIGLIAQGMGIAPLLSILDAARGPAQLILATPTAGQVYPKELLPRHVEYIPCVGHEQGEALRAAIVQTSRWAAKLYVAGPTALYRQARQALETTHLTFRAGQAEVWWESEIGCGLGACQACVIETRRGPKRVCVDGPAFDLYDLLLD